MTTNATVDDAFQSYSTSAFYVRCLKDKEASKKEPENKLDPIKHDDYKYFADNRDGTEYPYVNIGKKNWMAKNLNYKAKAGNSACYNNLDENCDNYGRLYNWAAATSTADSVCPRGWNLPTDADWTDLTSTVGSGAAGKLKAVKGWEIKSTNGTTGTKGTDDYGFAALPGGYGNLSTGNFTTGNTIVNFGSARGGFWWSATPYAANGAYIRHIGPTSTNVTRIDNDRSRMYSVRCVSEGDFCGGEPYDKNKEFCLDKKIIPLCSGKDYNPATQFCQDSTEKILPLCNGKPHKYEQVCLNNELVYRDCRDFTNGTLRLHQEREKAQFCDPRDGQKYVYVNMGGDDIWMAENLNYEAEGTKCYGDATGSDSQKNCEKYGRLYTWKTASDKICPAGWHLPTRVEWNALGGVARDLKTKSGWNSNGIDVPPGFSALPGGRMTFTIQDVTPSIETNFAFSNAGSFGNWWSADKKDNNNVYYLQMNDAISVSEASAAVNTGYNREGFSVRCVRDTKCEETECEKEIDPALKLCGSDYYDDRKKEFCWEERKVGTLCGDNSLTYDPDLYECKPKININGIYLIDKYRPVDNDGNVYEAVKIGEQVWMAENMKLNVEGSECNDAAVSNYCDIYGRLYSQSMVLATSFCPEGWHIPSTTEWDKLNNVSALAIRAVGVWDASTQGKGTDLYGFKALPGGGLRGMNLAFGTTAAWWSTTQNNVAVISINSIAKTTTSSTASTHATGLRTARCLKNN
jgi:uncharacterized protein (TIGR02145 family)